MYRIYCYCSKEFENPKLKMYWNNRTKEWTFNKPTIVNFKTAFKFITNEYLNNGCEEFTEDNNGKPFINYYLFGIEKII